MPSAPTSAVRPRPTGRYARRWPTSTAVTITCSTRMGRAGTVLSPKACSPEKPVSFSKPPTRPSSWLRSKRLSANRLPSPTRCNGLCRARNARSSCRPTLPTSNAISWGNNNLRRHKDAEGKSFSRFAFGVFACIKSVQKGRWHSPGNPAVSCHSRLRLRTETLSVGVVPVPAPQVVGQEEYPGQKGQPVVRATFDPIKFDILL